jgi:hypothetical protein
MDQLLNLLIHLYRERTVITSDGNGSAARALIAQQIGLYDTLLSALSSVPFGKPGQIVGRVGTFELVVNVFRGARETLEKNPPTAQHAADGWFVISGLPVLRDEDVEQIRVFINAETYRTEGEARDYGVLGAAGLVFESVTSTNVQIIGGQQLNLPEGPSFIAAMSRYAAAKISAETRPMVDATIRAEVSSLGGLVQSYKAVFDREAMTHRVSIDALTNTSIELSERLLKAGEELTDFRANLTTHEKAIREEWRLDRARLNWNDRFKEARTGFFISCGLLVGFLIVTILGAYFAGPSIVASVNHFDLALFLSGGSFGLAIAHQLGRLLVFSVPILVYLWMLKATMRFFMRSMLLMDDARQRETMLDTYFLLTEKGRADERDRPLILWALFRQTPGHGADGIEPPDFTEVINAGFNRAKSVAGQ